MFASLRGVRRWIGLLVFSLLALVPTAYVAHTAYRINDHRHPSVVARELGALLEMEAEISGLRYPRRGEVVYDGLVLRDMESHRPVARCRTLRLVRGSDTLALTADGAEIAVEEPRLLLEHVERLLRRAREGRFSEVSVLGREVAVRLGAEPERFEDFVAHYRYADDGPTTHFSFRLPEARGSIPSEVEIRRDRSREVPRTVVELRTGSAPLPVALLRPFIDATGWVGERATLQGRWVMAQNGDGWDADFVGRVEDIDLETLVSRHFPHHLTGQAQLQLSELAWRDGRIERMVGTLDAGPGRVGAALLAGLSREMGLSISGSATEQEEVDYRQLALAFQMERGVLRIAGRCPSAGGAAVLVGKFGPMAREPMEPASVAALVRLLVPNDTVMVPATVETDWLGRVLPMPRAENLPVTDHSRPLRAVKPAAN